MIIIKIITTVIVIIIIPLLGSALDVWRLRLPVQVLHANGSWSVLYFLGVMFLGSYFLLNLLLGIVSMAFEESQNQEDLETQAQLQELERKGKKDGERDDDETTNGDDCSAV